MARDDSYRERVITRVITLIIGEHNRMVHMFRSPHLELVCPACRKEHNGKHDKNNWKPEFWKHEHYKTLTCNCGYKIHVKTEHSHSGHY